MSFETAIRLTEVLLSLALIQQSVEHLRGRTVEQMVCAIRIGLCLLLLFGLAPSFAVWGLFGVGLWLLHLFQGPYNGGADKMGLLILFCLSAVHVAPSQFWAEMALSYLAVQLVLSYVVSGWVKLRNPEWRSGAALADVFRYSAYPVSEGLRSWGERAAIMGTASWSVILLEIAFPLSLAHPMLLAAALCATGAFHLCNACVFGLNRFFWIWLSAYPSLIWFQGRILPLG